VAIEDDDVPVLSDIVRSGDESIIQSTRLERVGIDRLDSDSTAALHFELPAHLHFDHFAYDIDLDETLELDEHGDTYFENQRRNNVTESRLPWGSHAMHDGPPINTNSINPDDLLTREQHTEQHTEEQLELLIDEIIDRHIISLRTDLRKLLQRARDIP